MLLLGHGNVEKAGLFPHSHNPYFYFFGANSLKNLSYKWGEGGASASHPHVEAIFKRIIRYFLTIQ
jgi:hypothetical protein